MSGTAESGLNFGICRNTELIGRAEVTASAFTATSASAGGDAERGYKDDESE